MIEAIETFRHQPWFIEGPAVIAGGVLFWLVVITLALRADGKTIFDRKDD